MLKSAHFVHEVCVHENISMANVGLPLIHFYSVNGLFCGVNPCQQFSHFRSEPPIIFGYEPMVKEIGTEYR